MSRLKIAFVSDVIYPFIKGGAEKRIYDISTRLARKGHEVHLFGVRWWDGKSPIDLDGVTVHGVCPPLRLYAGARRSLVEPAAFSAALVLHILQFCFDLIDCSEFPFLPCFGAKLAALATNVPLVVTWHEVWGAYWKEYLGKLGHCGSFVERSVASLSDHLIAVSDKVRRDLASIGVNESSISVIPNGIDFESVMKTQASYQAFDLFFAGRLIREKNLDLLVNAIAVLSRKHPSLTCAIVGDGPERNRLIELARQLHVADKIAFLGTFQRHEQVISLLKSSKIFVLPSSREGFSTVLAEAKACKLPAVVYAGAQSAAPEMIQDGRDGLLFYQLEVEELADRIERLLSDEDLRANISDNAFESARRYDIERIIMQVEATYRKVLEEFRRRTVRG